MILINEEFIQKSVKVFQINYFEKYSEIFCVITLGI